MCREPLWPGGSFCLMGADVRGRIVALGTSSLPGPQWLNTGKGHHFKYIHKEAGFCSKMLGCAFGTGNGHLQSITNNHSSWM